MRLLICYMPRVQMQFKLSTLISAALVIAGTASASILEARQSVACNGANGQPCGNVGATLFGISASVPLPACTGGRVCTSTCTVNLALPSPLNFVSVTGSIGVRCRDIAAALFYNLLFT